MATNSNNLTTSTPIDLTGAEAPESSTTKVHPNARKAAIKRWRHKYLALRYNRREDTLHGDHYEMWQLKFGVFHD